MIGSVLWISGRDILAGLRIVYAIQFQLVFFLRYNVATDIEPNDQNRGKKCLTLL